MEKDRRLQMRVEYAIASFGAQAADQREAFRVLYKPSIMNSLTRGDRPFREEHTCLRFDR